MTIQYVSLAKVKAEEMKEGFPDGKVPVSQLRADYDPELGILYFHVDVSSLTVKQTEFMVQLGRRKLGVVAEGANDYDVLAAACLRKTDTLCLGCGAEGPHNCQAETDGYEHETETDDYDFEDDVQDVLDSERPFLQPDDAPESIGVYTT